MTCARCCKPIVQPKTGRRRKWCGDPCKVAACRERASQKNGLTLVGLAERLSARGVPTTEEQALELVAGLDPGYVERGRDGRFRLTHAADAEALHAFFSLIEDGNVSLDLGDEGAPIRLRPGPEKRGRRETVAA